ncbi:TetR/AcrR family transcriptional regulator [Levilactobacillus suantsaiihabitans]|uniref:TetR/AcrR family transcriptional regulator n=1 Tax=Levilactobacillus suantsaiihabitans TaxID=2487722 RepID=A0A4Z0JAX6_9LACO|nr:TetR/AcrR family transcriptional regulator [Levilactobacillus suantsaiihabitans]TGD19851.1 TetR/AcrR family transcriptional regulator [Levilactobacillus suantsaiihabitans]
MPNKKILDEFPEVIQANPDLTQKQKDVLITSIRLFAEQGYANTSTRQIAAAAHQSEGTMFKHFKSKANILRAALEPIIHEIIPDVEAEFKRETLNHPAANLHDFLDFFVRNRMAFAANNQDAIKVFFSELLYNETLRTQFIETARNELIAAFKDTILTLQKNHIIIDWPFNEIFRYMIAVVVGYVLDRYVLFPDRDWDDDVEATYLVAELEKVLQP